MVARPRRRRSRISAGHLLLRELEALSDFRGEVSSEPEPKPAAPPRASAGLFRFAMSSTRGPLPTGGESVSFGSTRARRELSNLRGRVPSAIARRPRRLATGRVVD